MPDTAVAPPPPHSGGGGVTGGGSGIGQLLRDPEHYEEISVIGNGELEIRLMDFASCRGQHQVHDIVLVPRGSCQAL